MLQFKSHCTKTLRKAEKKDIRGVLSKSKSYEDLDSVVEGLWNGEEEMDEIVKAIESRVVTENSIAPDGPTQATFTKYAPFPLSLHAGDGFITPGADRERINPVPEVLGTPCQPLNLKKGPIPALLSGEDALTPSPSPA